MYKKNHLYKTANVDISCSRRRPPPCSIWLYGAIIHIFLQIYLLATPDFMYDVGSAPSPAPPSRVPKISQETSMATSVPGGYYVNMGN